MDKSTIQSTEVPISDSTATPKVDLKNPALAVLLTFLLPGAGHYYQGRKGKGILFCLCIMGLFLYGLVLSSGSVGWGRSVYWKWNQDERRFYFLGQVFIGAPALPAWVQATVARKQQPPLLYGFMAPPLDNRSVYYIEGETRYNSSDLRNGKTPAENYDYTLHQIRKTLNSNFELGTLFTFIAGMLNLLIAFDAAGGVVVEKEKGKRKEKKQTIEKAKSC